MFESINNNFYFNFLSVSAFITSLLGLIGGVFYGIIQNKSFATKYLSRALFAGSAMFFSIFVLQTLYNKIAIYAYIFTFLSLSILLMNVSFFLIHYPSNNLKIKKYTFFYFVQIAILIVLTIFFFSFVQNEKTYYNIDSHHWDINISQSFLYFVFIVLGILLIQLIGSFLYKILRVHNTERRVLIIIATIFTVAGIILLISNFLYFYSTINGQTNHILSSLISSVVVLALFVIHLNNFTEKTTLVGKIIITTMVSILSFFQIISFVILQNFDNVYDKVQYEKISKLIVQETDFSDETIAYSIFVNLSKWDKSYQAIKSPKEKINFDLFNAEYVNTSIIEEIKNHNLDETLKEITEGNFYSATYFRCYGQSLLENIKLRKNKISKKEILAYLAKLNKINIKYARNINEFPNENFSKYISKYLAELKNEKNFEHFYTQIKDEIDSETNEGFFLKQEVLKYIAPIREAGSRIYRQDEKKQNQYISYLYYEPSKSKLFEIGVTYTSYRKFISHLAIMFIYSSIAISLFFLIFFPQFFKGSISTPLLQLIKGIAKVDTGELSYRIKVKNADEIGRITDFFNKMTKNIEMYTSNLESLVSERTKELEIEKTKADELLLNILPLKIANELKKDGHSKPQRYESVTVMFTDFVGFTKISENLSPEEVVDELDQCFSYFDQVTEKYKLEKLKTIGDSFMCAGGLPIPNNTHPMDCIMAALEIQAFMQQVKETREMLGLKYWELRLGIATGPVVSGVVGQKKFAYDIWGDTVNIASRMESSGSSGKINISQSTYEHVKYMFDCSYRGKIKAKNKGNLPMFFVNGIKKKFSIGETGFVPNEDFIRLYRRIAKGAKLVSKKL